MSIEDKIKHLLKIANDPAASDNERKQAQDRASAWMIRHNIKISLEDEPDFTLCRFYMKGVYGRYKAEALYMALAAYGMYAGVVTKGQGTSDVILTISCPKGLEDTTKKMADSFLYQMERDMKEWAKLNKEELAKYPRHTQKRKRESFLHGFGSRLNYRIKRIREAEQAEVSGGREIVLMTEAKAEEFIQEKFPLLKPPKKKRYDPDWEAMEAGLLAGDRATINEALNGR